MKMYMTNHAMENDKCLKECDHWNETHFSNTIDNASSRVIDGHVPISETTGLPNSLTIYAGAICSKNTDESVDECRRVTRRM